MEEEESQVEVESVVDSGDVGQEKSDQRAPYVHPEDARDYRVEGNDVRDYVGVDPEYMTYANPSDAPILTDTERFAYTEQYDHLEGNADEVQNVNDEDVLDRKYADENGDGKDDVTGLTPDEFNQARRSAQEYRDNPNPETEVREPVQAESEEQNRDFNPFPA